MSVDPGDSPPPGKGGKLTAAVAIRTATEQFSALIGRAPDTVSGVRATPDGGWSVLIDVLELERVPATTSVMATYRVDIDATGELYGCERLRRYTRGTTDM
ncbi:gas vesicle protein [Lentzea sp. BCCO 10_0856]|uniref:Gas vesicle protein n=1 Tax=Lentzea miocenica TaxID=3095431 RepID=A0ABU4TER0_9PSEU|nr:gas vesicle protein [Lentzea sp. BCCO 10_0856]MDX8036680.1 gas vesicle protein [Lentzea sp. BCCO 10_0856]